MNQLNYQETVLNIFEDRIVQMVFESSPEVFIKWLRSMVGTATIEDNVIIYETPDKRRGGFSFYSDPSTKGAMIGFAIAGIFWTKFFPNLMNKINKNWKKQKLVKNNNKSPNGQDRG